MKNNLHIWVLLPLMLCLCEVVYGSSGVGEPPAKSIPPRGRGYTSLSLRIVDGDTIQHVDMMPVHVFRRPIDRRRYERLIRNVKAVYPIAREARRRLAEAEEHLLSLPDAKSQKEYLKQMEKDLKKEYTPIIKKMTFSQGKVLIKLIDRETGNTSFALVKELRGGFTAFFYQNIGRLFGMNLKDTYDKDGEDKMIEQIIVLYEAGVL